LSVVLPTYIEKDSSADVIRGFEDFGIVDNIVRGYYPLSPVGKRSGSSSTTR
jgi:hypothetical protein